MNEIKRKIFLSLLRLLDFELFQIENHCVKSAKCEIFSSPYFPVFGLR